MTCLGIPHLHHPTIGSARQAFAIRGEGHGIGPFPFEGQEFLASLRIPHLHILGVPPARQVPAIRAEDHARTTTL